MSADPVTYHIVKMVLLQHRRCFAPGGSAFCSCNEWRHSECVDAMEWHEHAAQRVAWAIGKERPGQ